MDRLNIVAHDKFQEIIDEANRPDSIIRLQQVILDPGKDLQRIASVVTQAGILAQLGGTPLESSSGILARAAAPAVQSAFTSEAEKTVAQATYKVLQQYEYLPNSGQLLKQEVQTKLVEAVKEAMAPAQQELTALLSAPDIAAVVAKATSLIVQQNIDIPRILVVPKGEVTSGFNSFKLATAQSTISRLTATSSSNTSAPTSRKH